MAHHQPPKSVCAFTVCNTERRELLRQRLVVGLERFQRGDHVVPTGKRRTAAIRTEFAPAREPEDDEAGEDAEDDLRHDDRYEIGRAPSVFGAEYCPVNYVADDARQEDHECVHHALDQREGYHVAIGDMTDLVTEHSVDLALIHPLQQTAADSH